MNTSVVSTAPAPRPKRFWSMVCLVAVLALLCFGITGCFRVGRDAAALRDGVQQSAPLPWDKRIEFSVGPVTLGLARFGLSFVDMEPEARLAIQALRGAEVGLYHNHHSTGRQANRALLLDTDRAMAQRGWDRLVTASRRNEMVAVYVPDDIRSPRQARVCVVVIKERDMVVASARTDLEPLLQIVSRQCDLQPSKHDHKGTDFLLDKTL